MSVKSPKDDLLRSNKMPVGNPNQQHILIKYLI